MSVILEHGNEPTNAMVKSALKSDSDSALKDAPLPLPKDNIQPPLKLVLVQQTNNSAFSLLMMQLL